MAIFLTPRNSPPTRRIMPGKFEVKVAKNGQYYFNLKATNGEVILTSEMYKAKSSALNGIESVKKNSQIDKRYVTKTSTSKKAFFVLRAGNHEVIGKSEMYESEKACNNGIASVKKNAVSAKTDDQSAPIVKAAGV